MNFVTYGPYGPKLADPRPDPWRFGRLGAYAPRREDFLGSMIPFAPRNYGNYVPAGSEMPVLRLGPLRGLGNTLDTMFDVVPIVGVMLAGGILLWLWKSSKGGRLRRNPKMTAMDYARKGGPLKDRFPRSRRTMKGRSGLSSYSKPKRKSGKLSARRRKPSGGGVVKYGYATMSREIWPREGHAGRWRSR